MEDGKLRSMTSFYVTRKVDGKKQMLLLYRIGSRVVADSYVGIGGHMEEGEISDAAKAAFRELYEEIGLREEDLLDPSLRYVTLRTKKGEIRQNYYFFAVLKDGVEVRLVSDEGKPEWVDYEDLLHKNMPFTAYYVVDHFLKEGQFSDDLYAGIAHSGGVSFRPLVDF